MKLDTQDAVISWSLVGGTVIILALILAGIAFEILKFVAVFKYVFG